MNFGLGDVARLRSGDATAYSASFTKRFGLLSTPPPSPMSKMEGEACKSPVDKRNRLESEGDFSAAIQYEDCTGAAYRIRRGVPRTSLQVGIVYFTGVQ